VLFAATFCHSIHFKLSKLDQLEIELLENLIFEEVYQHIQTVIKAEKQAYCKLIHAKSELEDDMLEKGILVYLINDLINSGDYTLQGVANYTHTPEDVLIDICIGKNTSPSYILLRRIVLLHRFVRPAFYDGILKKIAAECIKYLNYGQT